MVSAGEKKKERIREKPYFTINFFWEGRERLSIRG